MEPLSKIELPDFDAEVRKRAHPIEVFGPRSHRLAYWTLEGALAEMKQVELAGRREEGQVHSAQRGGFSLGGACIAASVVDEASWTHTSSLSVPS